MQSNLVSSMKEGMRRLASGVSVITVKNAQGQRFAMTASSVTSVSDAPPSLLVCVNRNAALCQELGMHQVFAVNVLGQQHKDVSVQCSFGAKGEERFNVGKWGEEQHTPILQDAEASFVCRVEAILPYGSHHVVVGEIVQVIAHEGELDPLVYWDGNYRHIGST